MKHRPTQKRLDTIELKLTPKQWAISLANEMRQYPSQKDFLKAIAKSNYRNSPFAKPFYALAEQAAELGSQPKSDPERIRLNRQLRSEFHALKSLIVDSNETIKRKAETTRLKVGLQLYQFSTMISRDAFGQTARKAIAWIEKHTSADAHEESDRKLILQELLAYQDGFRGNADGDLARPAQLRLFSLFEECADTLAVLAFDVAAHRAAIEAIQKMYFDDHSILYKDIEGAFETSLQMSADAITLLNARQEIAASTSNRPLGQQQSEDGISNVMASASENNLRIDINAITREAKTVGDALAEDWVKAATYKGTADILEETGEHEDYVWQRFREKAEMN